MSVNTERVPFGVPVLVEASAGTGKTYAITTYFVRAILERDLSPEQILVVTYTKAATAELRVRTRERISNAIALVGGEADHSEELVEIVADALTRLGEATVERRLRSASSQMDQAPILTIHGFCQRLLQDYPLLFGIDFDFDVAEEPDSLLQDVATDFWTTELHQSPEWLLRALKKRKISPEHLSKLAKVALTPGIPILGPEPTEEPHASVTDRWLQLMERAGVIWREERGRISKILLEDPGLNRGSYRIETVKGTWIPTLDDLFAKFSFELPRWFHRLAQSRMKTKVGHSPPKHPFFDACERLIESQAALIAAVDHAVYTFQRKFIDFARAQSRERQRQQALLTYDDLLARVHESLDSEIAAVIRKRYPLALIDEFQDTDSIQWGIFQAIYGEHAAVYVGDPKQAIYAFRGADVFSYLEAAKDVGEAHALTTNRRSDPNLVEATNTLFSNRSPPFVLDGIELPKASAHYESRSNLAPALEILLLERGGSSVRTFEQTIAKLVATEIALLLESEARIEKRPVCPNDIAVLCRKNRQAMLVTEALRALRIPSSLDGDASVLSTEIAQDIEAVLEATLMPGDGSAVRRAMLTRLLGVSPYELNTMSDEDWSGWVSRFRTLHEKWHNEGVVRFLEELLRTTEAETRIATDPTARRKLTDLLHIEELLLRGERERRRDPVALMSWFRRLRRGSPEDTMVAYEELQQRPDAESDTIRVTTIHKSKGLEYGIVYCPFLWKDAIPFDFEKRVVKFHDPDDGLKAKLDLGSAHLDAHREVARREALSEALRLLYVAVTRAKHRCSLLWGLGKGWDGAALSYLLHGEHPSIDEEQALADIEALVDASKGTIGWRRPHPEVASERALEAPAEVLRARDARRRFSQANRIASFTSLTGSHEKTAPLDPEARGLLPPAALFSYLPGGARTGLLLHTILERVDLSELEADEAESVVERELRSYGYDAALCRAVLKDLQGVARTPLTSAPDAPRLEVIPRGQQLRELEFTLSANEPDFVELSRILKEHDAFEGAPDYPDRIASETSRTLKSFLRGFIDLVFEWEGRWYVADYKSNSLPSYDLSNVTEAAAGAHYLLQMQLYAAAVNRHLGQRLAGYDPEHHWGGVMLLFLRGMGGADAPGSSILFDPQTPALIQAVDEWLGRGP